MSRYPQYAGRVPQAALDQLHAIAAVTSQPQWRVLADAIDAYVQQLPAEQRTLLQEMLSRADRVFAQPTRAPRRPRPAAAAPITVLNVDDNDAMRFARTRLLEAEGYRVLEAPTGRAALSLVEEHRPRVVLLDVNLPDMSGLDVCRAIRADDRFRDIKVVQTSATFSSPHDQLQGLIAGGADMYLVEPVSRGTLLSVLRRVLAA
jgi:CheY-like chemotaxis protein